MPGSRWFAKSVWKVIWFDSDLIWFSDLTDLGICDFTGQSATTLGKMGPWAQILGPRPGPGPKCARAPCPTIYNGSRAQARILAPGPALGPIFGPMGPIWDPILDPIWDPYGIPNGIPYGIPYGIHMGSHMRSNMGSHIGSHMGSLMGSNMGSHMCV